MIRIIDYLIIISFLFIFSKICYSNSFEELKSLPYLSWTSYEVENGQSGVIKYDKEKSFYGYNLYTDDVTNAYLMDMTGRVIHIWRFPPQKGLWEYVRLLNRGDIIALCVGKYLVKLDRNSKVIWERKMGANHDIEVLEDGTFLVPAYKPPVLYNGRRVIFDAIFHVSKDGNILSEWWTYKYLNKLQKLHLPSALDKKENTKFKAKKDTSAIYGYYHLNTIQTLPDTPLGKKDKRFQKGNWLICLRNEDLICILDKNTKKILWSWGPGELDWPHTPTMLDNGNILIFDNRKHGLYSRVIEINPISGKILWQYKANPPEKFFSEFRGSNQRLPNGNTLITESENGRVFEVTANGEIVWEFINPEVNDGKRRQIYRMLRVRKEKIESWLDFSYK